MRSLLQQCSSSCCWNNVNGLMNMHVNLLIKLIILMKIHLSCQENLSCNGFLHVSVISHLRCYLKNTLVHSIFKRKRERKVRLEQGWRGVFRRSALLYRLQQSGTCNTIKAESVMGNISRNILMSVTFFPLSLLNT